MMKHVLDMTADELEQANWKAVLATLKQAQEYLEKDGCRHTWLDGAIDIANQGSIGKAPQAEIERLQSRLKDVSEGLDIVERNLAVAQNADPADAPFALTGAEATLWHKASASAYQHALEMCNSQALKAFVENGFNPVPDADAPVLKDKMHASGAAEM